MPQTEVIRPKGIAEAIAIRDKASAFMHRILAARGDRERMAVYDEVRAAGLTDTVADHLIGYGEWVLSLVDIVQNHTASVDTPSRGRP